jgi:prepilin-type N-terminal cleavage/methylation domain-containing protein
MKGVNLQKNKGFTIIETMIAISLFLVVITVGMEALLNASLINTKSQDMRSIMDNLSFIMDDMSKNLRTGHDYHCIDDGNVTATNPHDCSVNGGGISFKSVSGSQWVYTINSDGTIQKSVSGGAAGTFVVLSSSEIKIDSSSSFLVSGALPPPGDIKQPFVTVKLVGTITSKRDNIVTPFTLETSVSQRLIDVL